MGAGQSRNVLPYWCFPQLFLVVGYCLCWYGFGSRSCFKCCQTGTN